METLKKTGVWVRGLVVLAALAALAAWILFGSGSRVAAYPINPRDHIASWTFKGTYTGYPTFVAKANADLAKLRVDMREKKYDNYDLYIGMGEDYDLLGNGRAAYNAYNHAIDLYPNQGLAYTDLAALMSQLGARYTAADAYARAEAVQPSVLTYHVEQLDFLTNYFATDTPRVSAAFEDASKQFGDISQVLQIEAPWLASLGEYGNAIQAYQRAILLSPGRHVSGMQRAITQLKAKEAQQAAASSTKA